MRPPRPVDCEARCGALAHDSWPSLCKYTSNSARASSITFGAAIGRITARSLALNFGHHAQDARSPLFVALDTLPVAVDAAGDRTGVHARAAGRRGADRAASRLRDPHAHGGPQPSHAALEPRVHLSLRLRLRLRLRRSPTLALTLTRTRWRSTRPSRATSSTRSWATWRSTRRCSPRRSSSGASRP